jgi:hypothetical protein
LRRARLPYRNRHEKAVSLTRADLEAEYQKDGKVITCARCGVNAIQEEGSNVFYDLKPMQALYSQGRFRLSRTFRGPHSASP